jgi:hypothetical protein
VIGASEKTKIPQKDGFSSPRALRLCASLTRNPKLKPPICGNLLGINELKKSHQTALGIASIFFDSFLLQHLAASWPF